MKPLWLPYPPSANRYWRMWNRRMVVSAEAKEFKRQCAILAKSAGVPLIEGQVSIEVKLLPPHKKKRIDLDNCMKATLDSLQGIAYLNDAQLVKILIELGEPYENGALVVSWEGI